MNRRGILGLALLAALAGCQSAEKSRPPSKPGQTVVAVYTDIDGVSFSSDGATYARFTDFLEREENVRVTPGQLSSLVDALDREGFFKEKNRELAGKSRQVAPAIFRICVAAPGRSKECVFLCESGANVPARYREIFSTLPLQRIPASLDRFLKMNGQCDP